MALKEKVAKSVIKEIGKRLPKLAAKKSRSRLIGHMSRNSRSWGKAFQHTRAHFRPATGKRVHAVFKKKYRNEAALKALIRQAAEHPSRAPIITRLTVGGSNIGRPAVVLERRFKNAIGDVGDDACHILRIVVDFTGRPITAYPVRDFIGSPSRKVIAGVAGTLAATGAIRSAEAQGPIDTYASLLAAERAEHVQRSDDACDPASVVEWVVDFLVSPSCAALDPHELVAPDEIAARAHALCATLERRFGIGLDERTRQNIRADVIAAWGMGYRME